MTSNQEWPIRRGSKTLGEVLRLAGWKRERSSLIARSGVRVVTDDGEIVSGRSEADIWKALEIKGVIK